MLGDTGLIEHSVCVMVFLVRWVAFMLPLTSSAFYNARGFAEQSAEISVPGAYPHNCKQYHVQHG